MSIINLNIPRLYVRCMSSMAEYQVNVGNINMCLKSGLNILMGDIDSPAWGISYILSMYNPNLIKCIIASDSTFTLNQIPCSLSTILSQSCYMDLINPMFDTKLRISEIIENTVSTHEEVNNICNLFKISSFRYNRQLNQVGNEIFKCMAAVGYVNKKNIYCFPWISKRYYTYLGPNITELLNILLLLGKIIVFPTNFDKMNSFQFIRDSVFQYDFLG